MKVLVQPDEGIAPVLAGIESAKKTIEIVIFRFDRGEIEKALKAAAARGVFVHALIAYTNRGGEKKLRKLETRLLEAGVTVARTADNLARYHDKLMIIYDSKLTDSQMINLLQSRAKAGVQIKVIGRMGKGGAGVEMGKLRLPRMRLHGQAMIRDGSWIFVGSQSLRKAELDTRREVGVIIRDTKAAKRLLTNFEADWTSIELAKTQSAIAKEAVMPAAKAVADNLPDLAPIIKEAVEDVVTETGNKPAKLEKVSEEVREAVKEAVKEAVREAVEQAGTSE